MFSLVVVAGQSVISAFQCFPMHAGRRQCEFASHTVARRVEAMAQETAKKAGFEPYVRWGRFHPSLIGIPPALCDWQFSNHLLLQPYVIWLKDLSCPGNCELVCYAWERDLQVSQKIASLPTVLTDSLVQGNLCRDTCIRGRSRCTACQCSLQKVCFSLGEQRPSIELNHPI